MLELNANTIKYKISAKDNGVSSNKEISITLLPSEVGSGIRFIRTDLEANNVIKACPENISFNVHLNTCLSNGTAEVMFVEHIMCALWAMNIKNIDIEIDGPEVPLFDGSAKYFISMINSTGIKKQDEKYQVLKIKKEIRVEREGDNTSYIIATPSDTFKITYQIDYNVNTIIKKPLSFDILKDNFYNDISNARTFCLKNENETRKDMFSDGWNDFNNIKFDNDSIHGSEKSLRYKDEASRHKILDVIGDIAITNCKIIGNFDCHKSGHTMNHLLMKKILSDRSNYEII